MWSLARKLRKNGVLNLNRRNADFVLQYNNRKLYPIVDNKQTTKRLAEEAGIAVPTLYSLIEFEHQIEKLHDKDCMQRDFVIKPAHGAGGDGIVVITGRIQDKYRKINGELLSKEDLSYHISLTLSGAYSLGGHPTVALIEQRVIVDKTFAEISHDGVPDIRIITFLGYPVMAMARLPTRLSCGKANLHQGAIGVGVDISSGMTVGGVSKNQPVDFHPDTLRPIAGVKIPFWQDILMIAAEAYDLTELGFLGVDIVLDESAGPMMLELNARPGLNIQIANRQGLKIRTDRVERYSDHRDVTAANERVALCREWFHSGLKREP